LFVFITFEGPEGAGKTTLLRGVAEALRAQGRDVVVTREPGDGPVGAEIRQILLHGQELEPLTEVFLFLADRAQHVATIIKPALSAGKVVLCDRYSDSTVVYQGHARGLDVDLLREWNASATVGLNPDLTILLDLDPEIGLARLQSKDRLDAEPLAFHQRVRAGFLTEAEREPARWQPINASLPAEQILQEAMRLIEARFGAKANPN
jgi:dTMP kinase